MSETVQTPQNTLAGKLFSVIAVVFILYVLKAFIVPLLFAVILSVLISPMVLFLERKLHLGKVLSSLFGVVFIYTALLLLLYFIAYQVGGFMEKGDIYIAKFNELYTDFTDYVKETTGISLEMGGKPMKRIKIIDIASQNSSNINAILSYSTSFIGDALLMPLYMFFLLCYRDFFLEFIYKVFGEKDKNDLDVVLKKIYEVIQNYLLGLVTVMGIVGLLNSLGLLALGIENAFFFGFLGALLLLIPYVGITVGSLLPAVVALVTKDSAWYALGVIGVFAFVQVLEGNFITPKITGSKVSMNAFVSIISLVLFAMLWGAPGMILALPVTAILKVIFDNNKTLEPYGFLIGEPEKYHFKKNALTFLNLKYKKLFK